MKSISRVLLILAFLGIALTLLSLFAKGETPNSLPQALDRALARSTPKPPALHYSIWRTAPLTVAEVFGRAQGCADASPDLIEMTARAALSANLDPAIAAATVAVESSCNNYAISSRGAVGLMQVMPKIWSTHYDFSGTINLFNEEDNIRVGSEIMAGLIQQHGTAEGIQLYNGAGVGCPTCDAGYSARILTLAHR